MKKHKSGSAIVVIIITAVVFLVYTASTYTDILHLKTMHEKYFNNIQNIFELDYEANMNNI